MASFTYCKLTPIATALFIAATHESYFDGISFAGYLKGNGAVYKDLNLARVSHRAINHHVTC